MIKNIEYYTLANGLRVVLVPIKKAPVVNVTVAYKVGSKDESPTKTGLAHLFEHLMFDNIHSDNGKKFDSYCTAAGGECNAYTTYDHTLYHVTVPSSHTELALWLESQRMWQFIIPQTALDTQQNVVCEEIAQMVFNQPYGEWRSMQAKTAYTPDSAYHWEIYGSQQHVQSVTLNDARDWFNAFYRPNNACLVVCGDIDIAQTKILVDTYFANIASTTEPIKRNSFSSAQQQAGHISVEAEVPNSAVFLSYHFDGFSTNDSVNADVVATALGSGRSSRLYKSLVYNQQLASHVGCYADKREHGSLLTLYAFGATPTTPSSELYSALHSVLQNIAEQPITSVELHNSKTKINTMLASELQYVNGIADACAQQTLFWNDPLRVNAILPRVQQCTTESVHQFITNTIQPDRQVRIDMQKK